MTQRLTLQPHLKELGGGFVVRRALPDPQRRSVGPFVFFDHFGPVQVRPDDNIDVRPHPHIGLCTVSYLFEGGVMHRDSLGEVRRIEPGAINLMTAGRGIVHSERRPEDLRDKESCLHGLQLWLALPAADEEVEPSFEHTPAVAIPQVKNDGVVTRVLIGSAFGTQSPVTPRSPTLYLDIALKASAALRVPLAEERALYSVDAPFTLDGVAFPAHQMVLLAEGETPLLGASGDARVVLIGGAPLGRRHLTWNFVSSRADRIDKAIDDWRAQRFDSVPGETEFTPYP